MLTLYPLLVYRILRMALLMKIVEVIGLKFVVESFDAGGLF